MSVPLDRLYNFLHGNCNHDIIIYRFFPHGSRNLKDCKMSQETSKSLLEVYCSKFMIAHDQEPLVFGDWPKHFDSFKIPGIPYPVLKTVLLPGVFADRVMLLHSEKRSQELVKFEQDGAVGVYWWSHGMISRDWFRYAKHDTTLTQKNVQKTFLIYNRAWSGSREYRLKFTEMLVDAGLHFQSKTAFSPVDQGIPYTQHQYKNSSLAVTRQDLEHHIETNTAPSWASADYTSNDYQETQLEVVLETLFDDTRLHLTEKTLRPIACGHPFILCATHGSLAYLREYGFKTFGDFWDESYDGIVDPVERLQSIMQLLKSIADMPDDQRCKLFEQVQSVCTFNKERFFGQDFFNQLVTEYQDNINTAVDLVRPHLSGAYFKRIVSHNGLSHVLSQDTIEQMLNWLELNSTGV